MDLEKFVHEQSFRVENALRACALYDDFRRTYGPENVLMGPAWDDMTRTFSSDKDYIGLYVLKESGFPTLEQAKKATEQRGLAGCPCHR